MLSFDIRSLEAKAVQVDGALSPDDSVWEDSDAVPSEAIRITGRLSSAGEGRFYFSGAMTGGTTLPCRRCLEVTGVGVDEDLHLIFAETGADESDDPDVYLYDPSARMLDIRAAVREAWLLAAPKFAECRDECKGLCSSCGTNLNEGSCGCSQNTTDKRWDALLPLRGDAH